MTRARVFLALFLILTAGCGAPPDLPEPTDVVTIYQTSVSIGDPHIVSDSANRQSVIYSIYESLVRMDDAGNYHPSLSEGWSVSEDARSWTFKIRSGVKFHNGATLTADDIVATLGRVLDPSIGGAFGTQGVYLSYLGSAEISATDNATVRIITPEPMADLLDLVVAMPIAPASELTKLPEEHVGTGPYRISEQQEGRTVLVPHAEYWGAAPPYEELRWIAEPDAGKRIEALLTGDADIVSRIGLEGKRRLETSASDVSVRERESGLAIIYMLNAQDGPCQDPRVRQALNYALDMDTIIEEIKGGAAKRLNGYLTPIHFGYDAETPPYPHDPERARELLAEAGYGDGLTLTFDIPTTMPDEAPALTRMMVEQYERVGISVEIVEHADRPGYSEMVRAKQIQDACAFDSSPRSTYRVLREKLQSTRRGPWWEGYENEEVNALIERAEATVSTEERQEIYRQVYAIVRDDAPWIFLYNPTNYWGVRSTLREWTPTSDGWVLLN